MTLQTRIQNEEARLAKLKATGRNDFIARSVSARIEKETLQLKAEYETWRQTTTSKHTE